MSTSPTEILLLAESILALSDKEDCWRSAASRAYYAALHAARLSVPQLPKNGIKESSHDTVIRSMAAYSKVPQLGRTNAAEIAQNLPQMRRLRNDADYDIGESFPRDQCLRMIARAKKIVHLSEEITEKRTTGEARNLPETYVRTDESGHVCELDEGEEPPQPPPSRPALRRVQ